MQSPKEEKIQHVHMWMKVIHWWLFEGEGRNCWWSSHRWKRMRWSTRERPAPQRSMESLPSNAGEGCFRAPVLETHLSSNSDSATYYSASWGMSSHFSESAPPYLQDLLPLSPLPRASLCLFQAKEMVLVCCLKVHTLNIQVTNCVHAFIHLIIHSRNTNS